MFAMILSVIASLILIAASIFLTSQDPLDVKLGKLLLIISWLLFAIASIEGLKEWLQ